MGTHVESVKDPTGAVDKKFLIGCLPIKRQTLSYHPLTF